MGRRKEEAHSGGHGWFVTFADLMGLLVSFFVMLVAFSTQDAKKMEAVAGSMREAFGVQELARYSGVIESGGLPTRPKLRYAAHIQPMDSSITPTPDQHGDSLARARELALATASLRRALQDMPELAQVSKHIAIVRTREGLNIELVDQDGRSMFPKDSVEPYERISIALRTLTPVLTKIPFQISIIGYTAATEDGSRTSGGMWELAVKRANAVRRIFEQSGYPSAEIYQVAGKADTDPLFPEEPSLAPNRRITITLIYQPSAIPSDLQP
jgi:chemotaxis protein MotB